MNGMAQIQRERITETRIRSMDAYEIVDEIHKLEDEADNSRDNYVRALEREDQLRARLGIMQIALVAIGCEDNIERANFVAKAALEQE